MGRKSRARRARRKARKAMEVFVDPAGDKLDVNGKTELGRLVFDDAEQGEVDFYPVMHISSAGGKGGDFYDPDMEGGFPCWF